MDMNEFMLRQFIESLEETVDGSYTSTDLSKVETALREFCLKHNLAPHHRAVWTVGEVQELLRGCPTRYGVRTTLSKYFCTLSSEEVEDFIRTTRSVLTDKYNARVLPALADVDYEATDVTGIMEAMHDAADAAFRDTKGDVAHLGRIKPPHVTATTIDYEQRVMPKPSDATHPLHRAAIVDAETALKNALYEFADGVREDHLLQPNTATLFKRTINGPAFRALENAAKALSKPTDRVSVAWRQLEKKRKRDAEEERVDDAVRRVHEVLAQLPPHDRLHEIEAAVDELADARRKRARDA